MATSSSVEDDIAYLRQLAEAGASGLPSGGKYFLVWAIVIATGMGLTYGSVSGLIPIGKDVLNYCWAGALVAGRDVIGRLTCAARQAMAADAGRAHHASVIESAY